MGLDLPLAAHVKGMFDTIIAAGLGPLDHTQAQAKFGKNRLPGEFVWGETLWGKKIRDEIWVKHFSQVFKTGLKILPLKILLQKVEKFVRLLGK